MSIVQCINGTNLLKIYIFSFSMKNDKGLNKDRNKFTCTEITVTNLPFASLLPRSWKKPQLCVGNKSRGPGALRARRSGGKHGLLGTEWRCWDTGGGWEILLKLAPCVTSSTRLSRVRPAHTSHLHILLRGSAPSLDSNTAGLGAARIQRN